MSLSLPPQSPLCVVDQSINRSPAPVIPDVFKKIEVSNPPHVTAREIIDSQYLYEKEWRPDMSVNKPSPWVFGGIPRSTLAADCRGVLKVGRITNGD